MIKTLNQVIRAKGSQFLIKTMDIELTRKDSSKSMIKDFECISTASETTKYFTLIPLLKKDSSQLGLILKKHSRYGFDMPVLEFPSILYDLHSIPASHEVSTLQKYFEQELNFPTLQKFQKLTNKFSVYRDPWKSDIIDNYLTSESDLAEITHENSSFDFEKFLTENPDLIYFELNDSNRLENLRGLREGLVISSKVWSFVLGISLETNNK